MPTKPKAHNHTQLQERRKAYEQDRGNERERGYTHAWSAASKAFLSLPANRWCVRCKALGFYRLSECTDHIKPANHFPELFWVTENWQGICRVCHAEKTNEDLKRYGAARAAVR